MDVKEILDILYEVHGGISKHGRRDCAFAMQPIATEFDLIKVALAFSYEVKNTPEGQFFTTIGTPITVIFNEENGKSLTLPQHSFPMKTYDPAEVEALLREVGSALGELS